MIDVKLTNQQIVDYLTQIDNLLKRENEYKFNYALIKIKRKMQSNLKRIDKKLTDINTIRMNLCVEYCEKDEKGKPVIVNDKYKGLEKGVNKEFDDKFTKLQEDRIKFLETEIIIKDCYGIQESLIPDRILGSAQEALLPFIIDSPPKDEQEKGNREIKLN